jgi:hypothetical protein
VGWSPLVQLAHDATVTLLLSIVNAAHVLVPR